MKNNQVYAVVDLETTGSSFKDGDRIIQIGIVLIEQGAIIESFETKLNPQRSISPIIQNITGISNKMVVRAPYFEDVAPVIHQLLEGCVFIAHNILFDYRFLNDEFERVGLKPLTLKGIDTVQLAQTLLPTSSSYSLGELAESLHIKLDNPHNALQDAYATAELYLYLEKKACTLPLVTLERLATLSTFCLMDTSLFFDECLRKAKKEMADLPENLYVYDKIAYQKIDVLTEVFLSQSKDTYPNTKEQKLSLYGTKKHFRETQSDMMDAVYAYLDAPNSKEHLAIEAPSGVGKTLGYLLPAAYVSEKHKPIVISTYTTLLQQQLIDKEMDELQQLLPFPITYAVLKSSYHYIDIKKWKSLMQLDKLETAPALYSMRILVWLTETLTGDLDELNIQKDTHRFWEDIRHKNQPFHKKEASGEQDFYMLSRKKAAASTFVITNHSYLAHQWLKEKSDFPSFQTLIVDEAHRFSEATQGATTSIFHYAYLISKLKHMGAPQNVQSLFSLIYEEYELKEKVHYDWKLLDQLYYYVMEEVGMFGEEMLFYLKQQQTSGSSSVVIQDIVPEEFGLRLKKQLKDVCVSLFEYTQAGFRLIERILEVETNINTTSRFLIDELYDGLTLLSEQRAVLYTLLQAKPHSTDYYWCRYQEQKGVNSLSVHVYNGDGKNAVLDALKHVPHVVYVSGTLAINNNFGLFEQNINNTQLKTLSFLSEYDFKENTRLYVPENLPLIKELSVKEHAQLIGDTILALSKETEENMMVLFTSHDTLRATHAFLLDTPSLSGRELLAQSISGSREKITKRFFRSRGGILLGAESFWEGMDLPGSALKIVVVTRLPFDFPERPLVKARHAWMRKNHKNPFVEDALPQAAMKLKQSFGRLIRTPTDKGVYVLLDNRIFSKRYGRYLQHSFPKDAPLLVEPLETIAEACKEFLEKDEKRDKPL